MCFPAGRCHGVVPQYIVCREKKRTRIWMATSRPGDRFHCLNTHRSQPVGALVVKQHFCPQDNGFTDSPAQCATLRPSCYRNSAHKPSDDACSAIRREKSPYRACRPHSIESTPRSEVRRPPVCFAEQRTQTHRWLHRARRQRGRGHPGARRRRFGGKFDHVAIGPAATCPVPYGPATATWSAPSRRIS